MWLRIMWLHYVLLTKICFVCVQQPCYPLSRLSDMEMKRAVRIAQSAAALHYIQIKPPTHNIRM